MKDEIVKARRAAIDAEAQRAREAVEAAERKRVRFDLMTELAAEFNFALVPMDGAASEGPPAPPSPTSHHVIRTFGDLVALYCAHEESPYRKVLHATRQNYDSKLRHVRRDLDLRRLAELSTADLQHIYEGWLGEDGTKIRWANDLVTMAKGVISFGTDVLKDSDCERVFMAMRNLRFKVATKHRPDLTAAHVEAFRGKAHAMGMRSLALAQAFQFECDMTQKDVIGEWVPVGEKTDLSAEIEGNTKWVRGLKWDDIDANLVLRTTVSWERTIRPRDLKRAPMVMQELAAFAGKQVGSVTRGDLPGKDAVVKNEATGRPWRTATFREKWRAIADAVGIPPDVKNSGSRRTKTSRRTKIEEQLAAEDDSSAARR
jgi:hypothetical protein